ncbi:MAG TPA: VOC family protein, partial [Saliniramus sp.]|nr:VOC family protein [Saliniramus sp.]
MSNHGIHHVTAMARGAQRNVDFFTDLLGLRLVKQTVNFDDPATYHLYYADDDARPGSVLTFFPWENAAPGRRGTGETVETAFRVAEESLGYWLARFVEKGVPHEAPVKRNGLRVLSFTDLDGMGYALVGIPDLRPVPGSTEGEIPAEHRLAGFESVTLSVGEPEKTAAILTEVLGFELVDQSEGRWLLRTTAELGAGVDLVQSTSSDRPRLGAGSVHHVAFRASSDAAQAEMARKLRELFGITATEQKDRNYFRSIYFREPNGVLFEIATLGPGFATDEDAEHLGERLSLPPA